MRAGWTDSLGVRDSRASVTDATYEASHTECTHPSGDPHSLDHSLHRASGKHKRKKAIRLLTELFFLYPQTCSVKLTNGYSQAKMFLHQGRPSCWPLCGLWLWPLPRSNTMVPDSPDITLFSFDLYVWTSACG